MGAFWKQYGSCPAPNYPSLRPLSSKHRMLGFPLSNCRAAAMCVCTCVYTYIYMCIYIEYIYTQYLNLYLYVHTYVYMYRYIYIQLILGWQTSGALGAAPYKTSDRQRKTTTLLAAETTCRLIPHFFLKVITFMLADS